MNLMQLIGFKSNFNFYRYVRNDPVNGVDPVGLWNLWNPATWGISDSGSGIRFWDSLNPFDESANWRVSWNGFAEGGLKGLAAWADGFIPFWDPFEKFYEDECGEIDNVYKTSCFLGCVSRDLLIAAAGVGLTSRSSSTLANNKWIGKGSRLFGRGGRFGHKGIFNRGPIRTGWGWKGSATSGRDVFRTSWSRLGKRSYWNHLDWF